MSQAGSNTQRWLVSYADMVTLLFALFLVLFAVASVDNSRLVEVAEELDKRLKMEERLPPPPVPEVLTEPEPVPGQLLTLRRLETQLEGYDLIRTDQGLSVSLASDGILFDSGEAQLKTEAEPTLRGLMEVLRSSNFTVRIEGHTDSMPIHTERFKSNWELSLMRAWAVANYFLEQGIEPERISVMGLASRRPVASETSAAGRAKNRRVVLIFDSKSAAPSLSTILQSEASQVAHDTRPIAEHRSGSVSVWTSDPDDPHASSDRTHHLGPDNLFYQDYSRLGPYQTGTGDAQYSPQRGADTLGPLSYGVVDGVDIGQGL